MAWRTVALLFACAWPHAHGLNTGLVKLKTSRSWAFATRFCFRMYDKEKPGLIKYTVKHRPDDQVCLRRRRPVPIPPPSLPPPLLRAGAVPRSPRVRDRFARAPRIPRVRARAQVRILLYTNGWSQFSAVNSATYSRYSCEKRIRKAAEIIYLRDNDDDSSVIDEDGYKTTEGEHEISRMKEGDTKWAFVAISNCAASSAECNTYLPNNDPTQGTRTYCQSGIDVEYELSLTNPGGGSMVREFSAVSARASDARARARALSLVAGSHAPRPRARQEINGVLPVYVFFFATQTVLVVAAMLIRMVLSQQKKYHHTAQMVVRASVFQWLAIIIGLIYYSRYALSGKADRAAEIACQLLFIVSDILMVLLFIVLAKGWTIVRRKISVQGRIKIAIYTCTYMCVSIGSLIAYHTLYSPEEIPYYYGSPPGMVLIGLRIFAAAWFYYGVYTTQVNFNMKKAFYRKFTFVGLLWMLYVPILALIGLGIEDDTRDIVRLPRLSLPRTPLSSSLSLPLSRCCAQAVLVIQLLCVSLGQFTLVLMYNPNTRFNRSFPFHAKTSDDLGMRKGMKKWAENMRSTQRGADGAGGEPPEAVSVTGGLGSGRSQDGKISLNDGFERVHLARLKRVHQNLEERIGLLQLHSHELGTALGNLDFGGSIDEILNEPESRPMRRPAPMDQPGGRPWMPRGPPPQQQQMPPPQQQMRPRGPLDAALDDALPQHSFAAQRSGSSGGSR